MAKGRAEVAMAGDSGTDSICPTSALAGAKVSS